MTPPLKIFGGKHYLAKRIVALMPPHLHYVEPYFGGGAVLFARNPDNSSEVVNDINGRLMNFWRTLQDPDLFTIFQRTIEATPFSETEWRETIDYPGELGTVDDALSFFINCRMSMSGRGDSFAPLTRNRLRRGMNEQASAWLNAVEGLSEVHARLKRVVILSKPAVEVIRQQDGDNTLIYADPPYPHSTRTSTDVYEHEMTD